MWSAIVMWLIIVFGLAYAKYLLNVMKRYNNS